MPQHAHPVAAPPAASPVPRPATDDAAWARSHWPEFEIHWFTVVSDKGRTADFDCQRCARSWGDLAGVTDESFLVFGRSFDDPAVFFPIEDGVETRERAEEAELRVDPRRQREILRCMRWARRKAKAAAEEYAETHGSAARRRGRGAKHA